MKIVIPKKITNKYHNKKVQLYGLKFDSIKERNRYLVLNAAQKKGFIKELELQKTFLLQESFVDNEGKKQRPIYYIADFFYYDNKEKCYIAEDVKSKATRKDTTYRIKCKMFMYKYPDISFKEVL